MRTNTWIINRSNSRYPILSWDALFISLSVSIYICIYIIIKSIFSPSKRSFRGPGVVGRGVDLRQGPKSARGNWPLWPPVASRGPPPLRPTTHHHLPPPTTTHHPPSQAGWGAAVAAAAATVVFYFICSLPYVIYYFIFAFICYFITHSTFIHYTFPNIYIYIYIHIYIYILIYIYICNFFYIWMCHITSSVLAVASFLSSFSFFEKSKYIQFRQKISEYMFSYVHNYRFVQGIS